MQYRTIPKVTSPPPENNGFFLVNPESNGPPSESNVMDVKLAPFAC